jgi:hypothetical protein
MGAGFYGVNGISPHVSKQLLSIYVNPAVLYGLEAVKLEASDLKCLDRYHRDLLRQLQSLPDSTAKPAIYLLLGCLPMQALLHQNMLNLYITILHRPGSPEYEVMTRQLALKDLSSNSWTVQLRTVLFKYNLPLALELARNPPKKAPWKKTVKRAVADYWEKELKRQAAPMKTLKYLNMEMCAIGFTHPVWLTGNDPMQTVMAGVKVAMLVGRYPLTGHKCAGKNQADKCPHCNMEPETMPHFLLRCPIYQEIRNMYLHRLEEAMPKIHTGMMCEEDLVKVILDPSHMATDEEQVIYLEGITRRMCFAMHNQRAVNEGRGSMYQWASKRARVKGKNNNLKSKLKIPQTKTHLACITAQQGSSTVERRNVPPK